MNSDTKRKRPLVLVVDDTAVTAELIRSTLIALGVDVEMAVDGEEGLSKGLNLFPDLIILELYLPKLSGQEIITQLREHSTTQDIPVLVCTNQDYKMEIDQAYALGATEVMVKPFKRSVLAVKVGNYLDLDLESIDLGAENLVEEALYAPLLRTSEGYFKLWGSRGSIPVSGSQFLRHGGNTSCLEIEHEGHCIVFDAGSGIRDLGAKLVGGKAKHVHVFITHTHWDHIQGLPFFVPAFVPGFQITLYAPPNFDKNLESIFQGQLDSAYFPVQMEDMRANLEFVQLRDTPIEIGEIKISWEYTIHPSPTVGYRADIGRHSLAFVPDNEFMRGYQGAPQLVRDNSELTAASQKLIDFLKGVNSLIHECQFTNEEYESHIGWGHTSVSNAVALANLTKPEKWIVTHHDPSHDDSFLQGKLNLTRQISDDVGCQSQIIHGFDGMEVFL